jgi:hypothetical protein
MVCFKPAEGFDAVVLSILLLAGMPVCGRAWELHMFCDVHTLSPTPDVTPHMVHQLILYDTVTLKAHITAVGLLHAL